MVYAGVIMGLSPWIGALPILAQAPVYLVPDDLAAALAPFLIWMETGRWG
jgi:hypothetical protein